jgi:predicted DNA-binding transcriptional regulator YafY
MDVSRIYRLLRLVTLLQSGRSYTASDLAEELQVSRRTVFRDLNALEMAHIPYYYDQASRSYRISQHFFLQPVNLTLGESLALLTLAGRLEEDPSVPLLGQAARAAAKLESILPETIREHVGSIVSSLTLNLGPTAPHDDENLERYFDLLNGAIMRSKVIRMRYESFAEGGLIDVEAEPLRLVFLQRAWYLRAFSRADGEVRTYKLLRIAGLEVTREGFSRRGEASEDFGRAWLMIPEGKLHKIHLHFEPKVARNVAEVRWHDSQQVEFNDDGSMEFRVEVDGLGEIAWWILGYGDQVKVVKPAVLAKRIAETARRAAQQYDRKGS